MHELPSHSRTSPGHVSSTNVRTVCRRDAVSLWSKRLRPRRTERWPVRASSLSLASARACPAAHCCSGPRSCWALLIRAFCVAAQASDCSGCSAASCRDAMARRFDSNYRHRSRARAALRLSPPAAADLAANTAYATHSPPSPPVSPRARRALAARSPRARRALAARLPPLFLTIRCLSTSIETRVSSPFRCPCYNIRFGECLGGVVLQHTIWRMSWRRRFRRFIIVKHACLEPNAHTT